MASFRLLTRLLASHFRFIPKTICVQPISTVPCETADRAKSWQFEDLISSHREHAKNSILVEVLSRYALIELHNYCIHYGKVKKIMHYHLSNQGREYALVEFEDTSAMKSLLEDCQYGDDKSDLPLFSRLLQFRRSTENNNTNADAPFEFFTSPSDVHLERCLLNAQNLSEQMHALYSGEKLHEIGIRLRFFICTQIEDMLRGMFPHSLVLPFGSTVNGFGRNFCDLDMVLAFQKAKQESNSPMFFSMKRMIGTERMQSQRLLEAIGDNLNTFLPGVSSVLRILRARVPILKFKHDATEVQCDLTVHNVSGCEMASILFAFGEMDSRFRPLVFVIRKWAEVKNITSDSPGRWLTNFQLIMMVMFFLQKRPIPILPSLDEFYEGVKQENKQYRSKNSEDLGELLREFFMFYESFNYKEKALSVKCADTFPKPDYSAFYIENPLEIELNICKNVDGEMIKKLRTCMQNSLWLLESSECQTETKCASWGILRLFENTEDAASRNRLKKFSVTGLFDKMKKNALSSDPLVVNSESDIPPIKFENDNEHEIIENVVTSKKETAKTRQSGVDLKLPDLSNKQKTTRRKAGKTHR